MTAAVVTSPARSATPKKRNSRRDRQLFGFLGILTFLAILELAPRVGLVNPRFLPPFSEMVAALFERMKTGAFWQALADTLITWSIGLTIATVLGIAAGMLIGSFPLLKDATASTIEFLRPIPSVALIPLAVLTLGTGRTSTLLLIIYAAFWQILVQVLYGVQDVDPVAKDTARTYRLGFWTQGFLLVWPTALPYALTGFRLAAAVGLILAITGELIIGTPGLGKLIAVAQQSGAVAPMYGLILVTGLLGVLVNLLARYGEKKMLYWHASVRREAAA